MRGEAQRPTVEALEDRVVPASLISGGAPDVVGGAGNDTVTNGEDQQD